MKQNTRSNDFRYIYTNSQALQIGNGDATLLFGIKEDQTDLGEKMREEVGVIMTINTAKLLAYTLTRVLEQVEKANGMPIPLDQAKVRALEEYLEAASTQAKKV